MRAICQHCAADKPEPLDPCPACAHRPAGGERALAWLLSEHHLGFEQLDEAADRIRAGHALAPPARLLAWAEAALRDAREVPPEAPAEPAEPALPSWGVVLLGAVGLALTPVPAWFAWWTWRRTAPRAARQALAVALGTSLVLAIAWAAFHTTRGG